VSDPNRPDRPSDRSLPRGPHGLPRDLVAENQRRRLIAAMVRVCAAKGYEATAVADVLEAAGVGRETFYELFVDKEACFLAAHALLIDDLTARVTAAYERPGEWPARVRAGLEAMLEWFAKDPDVARVTIVEMGGLGAVVAETFQENFHRFTALLDEGRELSETARALPKISSVAAGAVLARIYEEVVLDRAGKLPELAPELTYELLLPYLGEERAREEAG
jgi:AcrR family transcriptional regulator